MSSLSRRSLLKGACGIPLLTLGGGLSFLARPAHAVEPITTALAVINIALAVSRLFSSSRSSTGDLLRLQTEMLRTISAQIAVVQRGIEQILRQLEEIQAMIGRLPAEVIDELFRRRINALLGTYDEIMATYKADLDSVGLMRAQRQNKDDVEIELLRPLRDARSVLFTAPAYINVPILSAALHVEVHAMIMADYRKSRILSALDRYRVWFGNALRGPGTSIEKRMADLRQQRVAVQEELSRLRGRVDCLKETQVIPAIVGGGPCDFSDFITGTIKVLSYVYQTAPLELGEISNSVRWLQEKGHIEEKDLPIRTVLAPGSTETDVTVMTCDGRARSSHPDLIENRQEIIWDRLQRTSKCPASQVQVRAQELGDTLTQTGYTLISLGALRENCTGALAAIDKFSEELRRA